MSNLISLETIWNVRYKAKYYVESQCLLEGAKTLKNKINSKNIKDILYVIEYWNVLSCNADEALYTIINGIKPLGESDQKLAINSIDNTLLPIVSEQCIVNLTEQLSLSENANYTLLDKLDKYRLYHRISGNFNKLNNRIGFKKIVKEANYYKLNEQRRRDLIDSLIKTIYETYNIKDSYKFNITLESVLYGFKECGITLDHEYAMRCVTEFYTNNTDMDKNEMKNIIQEVNLYNENARTNVLVLFEENKKVINIAGRSVVQSTTVKTLCDAYNTVKDKSIENLKSLFTRIYARSLEECVNESSNVLTIITTAVTTVGATAINPVLGLLVAFTNCIISREANIKQTDIYLKQLKKEKDKVQSKIDKTRGNTEELEKLLDKLELSIEKVSDYRFSIQSDNENDKDVDDSYMEANMSPSAMMAYIMCIDEAVKNNDNESLQLLTSCMESMSILNEDGNLMNTVKLVKEKLKNSASKLSTKEKALCKQMDSRFDIFVRNFERSLSLTKRENVIKGQVLPSVTNMIKLATVGTIGALVAPAITAVALVAGFAVSKKATVKEKQYILDEIEVQLKIIDRKINQAEMKGDDASLEELYRLQARLTKESKRIKYRIRLYHEGGCVL